MEGFDVYLEQGIFLIQEIVAELAEDGFKTVVIIDPELKLTKNTRYIKGFRKDYFVNVLMVLI
jgi:hypothetical protein